MRKVRHYSSVLNRNSKYSENGVIWYEWLIRGTWFALTGQGPASVEFKSKGKFGRFFRSYTSVFFFFFLNRVSNLAAIYALQI